MNTLQFTAKSKDDINEFLWSLVLYTNGELAEVVDIKAETTQGQSKKYVATLQVVENKETKIANLRYMWLKGFITGFKSRALKD